MPGLSAGMGTAILAMGGIEAGAANTVSSPRTAVPPPDPTRSRLLIDASDVVVHRDQKIGEGGFGVVYKGTFRGSVTVAVKTFRGEMDEHTRAAFKREVTAWEGLVQRNILPLMAFCLEPPMMITDLVKDGNLRDFLARHAWDQALGISLLSDVVQGMAYLHSMNIVHGDLKGLNILVDRNKAMITDFGLAKMRLASASTSGGTFSSSARMPAGTPGFMAPELMMGQPLDKPADVFAFAMVCYEVLSKGKRPFEEMGNPMGVGFRSSALRMGAED